MANRVRFALGASVFLLMSPAQASAQEEAIINAQTQGEHAVLIDGTGIYSRQIATNSPVAQALFDQGLRLTWGYYFPEAYASFQEALHHDPDNPMILWGMALAASPNPNSRHNGFPDDPEAAGRTAISRANELSEGLSGKDRQLVEALYVRYDSSTLPDLAQRDAAYLEAARDLVEEYPDDPDIVSVFADASMIMSPWNYWDDSGDPTQAVEEAIGYLERSLTQNPDHPGTNHLYMHIMESSPHPERALPSANRLEGLMPRVGHMVHMPSHIYVRTGDYARSIESNRRSLSADDYFTQRWGERPFPTVTSHKLSSQVHPWHALDFIRYSAAVQGNYATALEAGRAAALEAAAEQGPSAGRTQLANAHVWMLHRIFGNWDAILSVPKPDNGLPYLDGMISYTRGSAFVAQGDLEQASLELQEVRDAAESLNETVIPGIANSPERLLMIAANILQGEIDEVQGNTQAAIAAFARAVEVEDDLRYGEPPNWPIAARLFLGQALLNAEQPAAAEQVFRRDLVWHQNNGWALFGLTQSLEMQDRSDAAATARARFEEAWNDADVELQAARF